MATKIVDQTKTWHVILNGTAASLSLEATLAGANGDSESATRLLEHANIIREVSQQIHKRFVEGNENKPPRTRAKRTQQAGSR